MFEFLAVNTCLHYRIYLTIKRTHILHVNFGQHDAEISRRCAVNSLRPSDTIYRQRTGSTLVQVMACCLMAPSHYLNQCWFIISKVHWYSSEGNFSRDASAINHWDEFEKYLSKIWFETFRGQWAKGTAHRLWPLLLTWFNFNPSMDK